MRQNNARVIIFSKLHDIFDPISRQPRNPDWVTWKDQTICTKLFMWASTKPLGWSYHQSESFRRDSKGNLYYN